jgi:hypothetical protein
MHDVRDPPQTHGHRIKNAIRTTVGLVSSQVFHIAHLRISRLTTLHMAQKMSMDCSVLMPNLLIPSCFDARIPVSGVIGAIPLHPTTHRCTDIYNRAACWYEPLLAVPAAFPTTHNRMCIRLLLQAVIVIFCFNNLLVANGAKSFAGSNLYYAAGLSAADRTTLLKYV